MAKGFANGSLATLALPKFIAMNTMCRHTLEEEVKMIWQLLLLAGMLILAVVETPTMAAARTAYRLSVQSVFLVRANSPGSVKDVLPANHRIKVGDTIGLECLINAGPVPVPRFSVRLYMDDRSLGPTSSNQLIAHRDGENALYVLRVPGWRATRPGGHILRCTVNKGWSSLPEKNYLNDSKSLTFMVEHASSGVATIRRLPREQGHLAPAGKRLHNLPLLKKNTKACRPTLMADVKLRPGQFSMPAWRPAGNGVQVPHVLLRLKRSTAAGNDVICTYGSRHGDLTLTTNLDCTNAHRLKAANTYRCEK